MSKLTLEMVNDLHRHATTMELFQAIQFHTAECVAEAVEEAVKDRYAIGERLQIKTINGWMDATVAIVNGDPSMWFEENSVVFRRPPITSQTTDDELRGAIGNSTNLRSAEIDKLSRPTLEAMAKDLGIETEVVE